MRLFISKIPLLLFLLFVSACATPDAEKSLESAESVGTAPSAPQVILVGEGGPSANLFSNAAESYRLEHGGSVHSVHNGDEFVQTLKDLRSEHGPLTHLEYFGHGNSLALFLNQVPGTHGALYANDPTLNTDYLAASIYELPSTLFAENGSARFNGCNVAEGHPEAPTFAQDFANHFKISVTAPRGPTEFLVESEAVHMVPTYTDRGFLEMQPQDSAAGSRFKDLVEDATHTPAVLALEDAGFDFHGRHNEFRAYEVVNSTEALSYCQFVVERPDACQIHSKTPEEKIRNLQVLRMFLDAGPLEIPYSTPWHAAYLSQAKSQDLLTKDFVNKTWYTRGELAEFAAKWL